MELIEKIKNAFEIYNKVDAITNTVKYHRNFSEIVEELNHYNKQVLVLAVIESAKKSLAEKGNYSSQEVLAEVLDLICHVNSIAERIDMTLVAKTMEKKLH